MPHQGLSPNVTAHCSYTATWCPKVSPPPSQMDIVNGACPSGVFPLPLIQSCPVLSISLTSGPSESAQFYPESGVTVLSSCPSLSAVTLMVLSHPPGLCPALPVRHGSFPKESQRGLSFPSMRSTQHWVMEGLGRAVHVKRKDHGLSGWGRPQKPEKSGGVT